jgi:hypothetical protein
VGHGDEATEAKEKEKEEDLWETGRIDGIGHYEWGCQSVKR